MIRKSVSSMETLHITNGSTLTRILLDIQKNAKNMLVNYDQILYLFFDLNNLHKIWVLKKMVYFEDMLN